MFFLFLKEYWGRKLVAKKAKEGGRLNHLSSLQFFFSYKITQGGGLNITHKFYSSLYKVFAEGN